MATLAAVQLEDLPVVVRFILHSATSADAYEVRIASDKKTSSNNCSLVDFVLMVSSLVSLCLGGVQPAQEAGAGAVCCPSRAAGLQESHQEHWPSKVR